MKIETIGHLALLSVESLIQRFGPSYGQYLYKAARGIDESPLVTHWEPKSFSRETPFQIDVKDWQTIVRASSSHETVKKEEEIRRFAFSCLKRVDLKGKQVRLVGVRVGNLEKVANVSLPL